MAQIIQNITLEVSKPNFFQAIVAKQYDSDSRFLKATLVNGAEKIEVLSTSTVTINAKRKDGAENSFTGEVNDDGTVTVPLTYWILELNGTVECDVSVIDVDGRKLTTTKFVVEVERASCGNGNIGSAEKYDILIVQAKDIVSKEELAEAVGQIATDYVVESGKKGNWNYRKWSSGRMEAWGIIPMTIDEISELGVSGLKNVSVTTKFPSEMLTEGIEQCSLCPKSWYFIGSMAGVSSNNLWGRFPCIATEAAKLAVGETRDASVMLIGRWE